MRSWLKWPLKMSPTPTKYRFFSYVNFARVFVSHSLSHCPSPYHSRSRSLSVYVFVRPFYSMLSFVMPHEKHQVRTLIINVSIECGHHGTVKVKWPYFEIMERRRKKITHNNNITNSSSKSSCNHLKRWMIHAAYIWLRMTGEKKWAIHRNMYSLFVWNHIPWMIFSPCHRFSVNCKMRAA